jgi:hypothetical protein
MSVLQIIAVKDNGIQTFHPIQVVPHVGLAIREFTQAASSPDTNFYKHPADFDLYHLGSWDDQTAVFIPLDAPLVICRAIQVKVPVNS